MEKKTRSFKKKERKGNVSVNTTFTFTQINMPLNVISQEDFLIEMALAQKNYDYLMTLPRFRKINEKYEKFYKEVIEKGKEREKEEKENVKKEKDVKKEKKKENSKIKEYVNTKLKNPKKNKIEKPKKMKKRK